MRYVALGMLCDGYPSLPQIDTGPRLPQGLYGLKELPSAVLKKT